MGVKEAESKYLAKQKRRRGLQKTRFYCQICERQCLDENGFKCHVKSELHMKNVKMKLEEKGGDSSKILNEYSEHMEKEFLRLLRISHGEKFVSLNKFYQEYISSRDHVHLNSTRWKSISGFAHYLTKLGKIRLEESNDGDHTSLRIAFVRDQDKGKKCNNNGTSKFTQLINHEDAGTTEKIFVVEMNNPSHPSAVATETDTLLSRQLATAETLLQKQACKRAGLEEESHVTRQGNLRPGNTLASRGKVAFTLKKAKKKGTK